MLFILFYFVFESYLRIVSIALGLAAFPPDSSGDDDSSIDIDWLLGGYLMFSAEF